MVRRLNKSLIFLCLALAGALAQAQDVAPEDRRPGEKDYKDKEQFEKFNRRRKVVSAWQISQLREGALVVRLKTNSLLIDALTKRGDKKLAEEKRLETAAINLNTMRAFIFNYTFSKVYFIYSNSSDTLMNGARSGIFVDTTLKVNPAITLKEKFYLLAERDYAFNSSIGFAPEDSARRQVEKGYSVKEMAFVVKNKYGHQLKKPFPYEVGDVANPKAKAPYYIYITINGEQILFNVSTEMSVIKTLKTDITFDYHGMKLTLNIPKYYLYERLSLAVQKLNYRLYQYYKSSPHLEENLIDPSIRPFLY